MAGRLARISFVVSNLRELSNRFSSQQHYCQLVITLAMSIIYIGIVGNRRVARTGGVKTSGLGVTQWRLPACVRVGHDDASTKPGDTPNYGKGEKTRVAVNDQVRSLESEGGASDGYAGTGQHGS